MLSEYFLIWIFVRCLQLDRGQKRRELKGHVTSDCFGRPLCVQGSVRFAWTRDVCQVKWASPEWFSLKRKKAKMSRKKEEKADENLVPDKSEAPLYVFRSGSRRKTERLRSRSVSSPRSRNAPRSPSCNLQAQALSKYLISIFCRVWCITFIAFTKYPVNIYVKFIRVFSKIFKTFLKSNKNNILTYFIRIFLDISPVSQPVQHCNENAMKLSVCFCVRAMSHIISCTAVALLVGKCAKWRPRGIWQKKKNVQWTKSWFIHSHFPKRDH